jgi:MFS family permease
MIKNIKIITAASFLSMLFLGISSSMIGAAARNIGLSPYQIGLMLTAQNLGFMISVLITGALADTYQKPRILMIGSIILAISLFAFYGWSNFWVNLAIMLMIGIGIGSYEGVTDAMLLDIHAKKESLYINVNHFFVTFGSIIITIYLIFLQMAWRSAIIQSSIVVAILAILFGLMKLRPHGRKTQSYMKQLRLLTRERLVIVLFIATALVVGLEGGTVGILTTYLMDLRGFTQVTSKIGLVVFLTGMATGRLILGYITPREQIHRYIVGLFALSTVVFSTLYFLDVGNVIYLIIFLAGLTLSAIFPLMLSLAGLVYPDIAGMVLGTIKVAIPIGGILLPFLLALLAKYSSFEIALIIFPLAGLLALILTYFQFKTLKKIEPVTAAE